MKWNASVDMTVTIDYEDIEADSEEEAKKIAEDMAREDIDYNNCNAEEESVTAFVWTDDNPEDEEDVDEF